MPCPGSRSRAGHHALANLAWGGGLIAVATLMVGFALAATATLHPVQSDPDLTRALWDASLMIPAVGAPAAAVFFLGNGLSILRSGVLPAWLGWLGIVTAIFNALGISAVFTDHGAFAADGVLGFFAGFLLFLLWTLLASITLVRSLGGPEVSERWTSRLLEGTARSECCWAPCSSKAATGSAG